MSDYESHKGKLVLFRREENETDKDYMKRISEKVNHQFEEKDWEDDLAEYISWNLDNEQGVCVEGKFYLNVNHKKLDPYDDVLELEGDDENGYEYFFRYYNGGAGFFDMVLEGFDKLKKLEK